MVKWRSHGVEACLAWRGGGYTGWMGREEGMMGASLGYIGPNVLEG